MAKISDQDRQAIIVDGDSALLVSKAQEFGADFARGDMKSTQIRSVFGTVRQIQASWPAYATDDEVRLAYRDLQMLKPKLAYQAARNNGVSPLRNLLTPMIDEVGMDRTRFQNFVDFFEAVLAYYKAEGGK